MLIDFENELTAS
jgi:hypothetical protein